MDANGAVTQASWTNTRNHNLVTVGEYSPASNVTLYDTFAVSPYTIPQTAYPAGTSCETIVQTANQLSAISNTSPGSDFKVYEENVQDVTLP